MTISVSSTNPLLYSSLQSNTPTKQQFNPLKTLSLPLNLSSTHPIFLAFSISQKHDLSPHSNRYKHGSNAFKCFVSAQNDPVFTIEEDAENEHTSAKKKWENVETLVRFYKEAVLAGDYHTIAEIETNFYRLEVEKTELGEKLSTMSEEITAGKERYIRLQADFDNFRKRSEKERFSIRSDAQGEVIESLLPMVDNFERAKEQIRPETEREKQIDSSYQGIYKQFVEIMRSLRVSIVATVGKPFDPLFHEAIAREESEEFKEGIVSQEFRRGFILGDRLLRPAMVKVSSGPGTRKNGVSQNSKEQPATTAGVYEP